MQPCPFGLPESRSIVDTKESVDVMLQFLAGKPVLVKDLFRLGKYAQNSRHRPRPVLIKLTTPWNRRLILLRKSNYAIPRLFVHEDVAPEHKLCQRKPKEVAPSATGSSSIVLGSQSIADSVPNSSGLEPKPSHSHSCESSHSHTCVKVSLPVSYAFPLPSGESSSLA